MSNVDRAYNKVRNELAEVGLLADGVYLDTVELCVSDEKSGDGECGYVFERVGHYAKRGYRPGVIYLPRDLPHHPYTPGSTLADTIRHEYAHAWFYLDSSLFRREWFARTFGAAYANLDALPYRNWRRRTLRSRHYLSGKQRRPTPAAQQEYLHKLQRLQFISDYAATSASEDFAETFMYYLKYRRTLERFASRPVVYQKIKMVERIVASAARRTRQFSQRTLRFRSA
ncbi:MAG: hypothetical protein KF752_06985 [Pirellulaceae bacterium]|nr:hypothetical protein [Pirellulaceae bacterium]